MFSFDFYCLCCVHICISDLHMYLPNKLFRSPQPALNLKDFPGPMVSQVGLNSSCWN